MLAADKEPERRVIVPVCETYEDDPEMSLMKAIAPLIAAAAMTPSGADAADCTPEIMAEKNRALHVAMTQALEKHPDKAKQIITRVQEVTVKYQGGPATAEACKAFDDALAATKAEI